MKELKKSKKKEKITLIESEDDIERKRKEFQGHLIREQTLLKIMMDKMTKARENIIFSTIAPVRNGMSSISLSLQLNFAEKLGLRFSFLTYAKLKQEYLKNKGKFIFDDEQLPRKLK